MSAPGYARSSPVAVRQVTVSDVMDVVPLVQASETQYHQRKAPPSREIAAALKRALAVDACRILLAHQDQQPVGYCVVDLLPKLDRRRGFLYVDELFVLSAHRRRGVATRLLRATAELAQIEGYAGVRLFARPENDAARALYGKLQFAEHQAILCEWLPD